MSARTIDPATERELLAAILDRHVDQLPTAALCELSIARDELTDPFTFPPVRPAGAIDDPVAAISGARSRLAAASQSASVHDALRFARAARALAASEQHLRMARRP
jgi:hypothetical protein